MKVLLVLSSSFDVTTCSFAGECRPNIIVFLADNLGYADTGANGCKDIPTPNIDSLAKPKVRQGFESKRPSRLNDFHLRLERGHQTIPVLFDIAGRVTGQNILQRPGTP
jgi:hypothetical protein